MSHEKQVLHSQLSVLESSHLESQQTANEVNAQARESIDKLSREIHELQAMVPTGKINL